jgi:hypothetical protein
MIILRNLPIIHAKKEMNIPIGEPLSQHDARLDHLSIKEEEQ